MMPKFLISTTTTIDADDIEEALKTARFADDDVTVYVRKDGGARASLVANSWTEAYGKLTLRRSVNDFVWSTRTANHLFNANIRTIGELTKWSAGELLARRGFGQGCLDEVICNLDVRGLARRETQAELPLTEAAE